MPLTSRERVSQLSVLGAPDEFDPTQSLDAAPNNLPLQVSSFIGRGRELAEIAWLLAANRLVTITGAGGCGKTRLALQAATAAIDAYPDGVWFVDLAAVRDPQLVPTAALAAVGIRDEHGRLTTDALADFLRHRETLLVIDNCEHLLDACARLADTLLRACPRLRLLVTSREPLGISGEAAWRVPSLALPDPTQTPAAEVLAEYDAVRLFAERARLVRDDFALTADNALQALEICRRLDGIPLAIELAAARVRALSVGQIAERLDDRFRLLTSGRRTGLRRHQTLQALVDWSHDLLTKSERVLVRRLAVFAGGCTLEAAESICATTPISTADVLDLLTGLVDKSLLVAEDSGAGTRYRLLETMRQYAAQKLLDAAEAADTRHEHLAWCLEFTNGAERALHGPQRRTWLIRLDADQDNLRAALAWSIGSPGNAEAGLRLATNLVHYWLTHASLVEGNDWLDKALAATPGVGAAARVRGLNAAAWLAWRTGDRIRTGQLVEESLNLCRAAGDQHGAAWALAHAALSAGFSGGSGFDEPMGQALATFRALGDRWGVSWCLFGLGWAYSNRGEHVPARAALEEAISLLRADQDRHMLSVAEGQLGRVLLAEGQNAEAEVLLLRTLAVKQEEGDRRSEGFSQQMLGRLARARGDAAAARDRYRRALKLYRDVGDRPSIAILLELFAELAMDEGQISRAAQLLGASDTLRTYMNIPVALVDQPLRERIATAGEAFGAAEFERARAVGRAVTLVQAVEYALEEPPENTAPGTAPPRGLTRREHEVAELIAVGLTNRQIADRLVIAERTADTHVQNILAKLGCASRGQIAALAQIKTQT